MKTSCVFKLYSEMQSQTCRTTVRLPDQIKRVHRNELSYTAGYFRETLFLLSAKSKETSYPIHIYAKKAL